MDYESVVFDGKDVLLTAVTHFDPEQTFECGQCFRWSRSTGGVWSGIAHGRRLALRQDGGGLVLGGVSRGEFESIWKDYFDLGRDYGELRRHLSKDEHLCRALAYSPGLRLMRQDPWETLITFILSQNSNIPRIRDMVDRLCEHFGDPLPDGGGHAFPSPCRLALLSAADLGPVRCGYRDKYIIDAAAKVSSGEIDLDGLAALPSDDIALALKQISGVGPKVADCTLLFGYGRVERFPLDVWMKKVMARCYPCGFPRELGGTAGLAQQFLFRYARANLR